MQYYLVLLLYWYRCSGVLDTESKNDTNNSNSLIE